MATTKIPEQTTLPFIAVFTGSDTISRDRSRDEAAALIRTVFAGATDERFDPMTESFTSFTERMITPSLFSEFRIFFVNHADTLTATELAELDHVAGFDVPDIACLIEADAVDPEGGERASGKHFSAFLKRVGALAKKRPGRIVVRDFAKPRDYEIGKWLTAQVPSLFGRSISASDAEYLVDLVGNDFDTIYAELQKIDLYLPEKKSVDRQSITEIVEGSRLINPWELAQSVGRRDLRRVIDMIESLFASTFYPPLFISALYQHFWSLFRVRCFEQAHPDSVRAFQKAARGGDYRTQNQLALEIGIAAGILTEKQAARVFPVMIKGDIVGQSLAFSIADFREIFRLLQEYDVGSKTGRITVSKTSFQLLCYRLARTPELRSPDLER